MGIINQSLLKLAQERIAKQSFVASDQMSGALGAPTQAGGPGSPTDPMAQQQGAPPMPGGDPSGGMGGQPGMGGMPSMDPTGGMGGGQPGMGGGQPGMGGGQPPFQPPAPGMMPPQQAPQQGAGGSGKPKFDPLNLDHRMYNMQQGMTAIMNSLGIQLPPNVLVTPPGTMGPPPAEYALPGGPMDPAVQQQQNQQQQAQTGGGQSQGAIGGIEGAGQVQGSPVQNLLNKQSFLDSIDNPDFGKEAFSYFADLPVPPKVEIKGEFTNRAQAIAALCRRNRQQYEALSTQ